MPNMEKLGRLMNNKTLYIWDAADTIFIEDFRDELGSKNMLEHLSKIIGKNATNLSDREYSKIEDIEFKKGVFEIDIEPGFQKVLAYTKNNIIVSSGDPSQTEYRRKIIQQKHHFDILRYFLDVTQVFDWNDDHDDASRNPKMFVNLINHFLKKGFNRFVYADDKLKHCLNFVRACQTLSDIDFATYHINTKNKLIKNLKLFKVNSLFEILQNERRKK